MHWIKNYLSPPLSLPPEISVYFSPNTKSPLLTKPIYTTEPAFSSPICAPLHHAIICFLQVKSCSNMESSGDIISSLRSMRARNEVILRQRLLCYCSIPSKMRTLGNPKSIGRPLYLLRYCLVVNFMSIYAL